MFDNLELPSSMVKYLISITPLLGISGSLEKHELHVFNNYIPLSGNRLLIQLANSDVPEALSLNILRKGEDKIIISGYNKKNLEVKYMQTTGELKVPYYIHSVLSFEAKYEQTLDYQGKEKLAIYEIISAVGVAGLDPSFNEKVTLAKTIEVMSLSAVDNYVIKRKLEHC
ncbi:MAG: hypothetical protein KGD64_14345 [Candidatus Heimdallarchaeota archaeon]|nr:hypothetical protein [Candidatus Heimdallarchaeota archaeon]